MARSDVLDLKSALLRGDDPLAQSFLSAADRAAASAQRETGGPIWAAGAAIPGLGSPMKTARQLASTAHELTHRVLPAVVEDAVALSPGRLRRGPHRFDLQPLTAAAPSLDAAAAATHAAERSIAGVGGSWLPPLSHARSSFQRLLQQLASILDTASAGAHLVPPMLGADGPRDYLLVFQNDAEARGLGGLPGAFTVLHADAGRVSLTAFGNDTALLHAPVHLDLGADFANRYDQFGVQRTFQNSDMSPNFPDAARIWSAMWEKVNGRPLDGALAADPTALSYLLRVTGPARLADGTVVSADNVVALTESAAYARFTSTPARKAFFINVARAAAGRVLSGAGSARELVTALGRAVGQRRLLVYSAHPDEQARLSRLPIGGVLPQTTAPFTALAVNNAAGSKLDYYLDRSLTYQPGPCRGNRRLSTVTVSLRNGAPAHGLPAYVVVRADHPPPGTLPGSERVLASLYATQGAQLVSVQVDGKPAKAVAETERGHLVLTLDLELAPGQRRTAVFHLDEPRTHGPVQTVRLPMVRPLTQRIVEPTC